MARQRVAGRAFVSAVGTASVLAAAAVLGAARGNKRLGTGRRVR